VAWQLRDTGLGLNHQDVNRTHCASRGETYSPDFLLYPDGRAIDCLGDGGGANIPQWQPKTGDATRWRAPFNPDEGTIPGPTPLPPTPPPLTCVFQPTDLSGVMAEIAALRVEVAHLTEIVVALASRPAPVPTPVTFPNYAGRIPTFGGNVVLVPLP
jgi:hypothetical protein